MFSVLAAHWPVQTGWAMVGTSPAYLVSGSALAFIYAGGSAAIGLYEARELRGRRYSPAQRFLLGLAAWQPVLLCSVAAERASRPEPAPRPVALGVGTSDGRPLLLPSGRF